MTNLLKMTRRGLVEDTYFMHHHFFPAEIFWLEKQLVHLRLLTHLFSPFSSSSPLSRSPQRIIIILSFLFLSFSLSLSYLLIQSIVFTPPAGCKRSSGTPQTENCLN